MTAKGVTGLLEDDTINLGGFLRSDDGTGPLLLACSYLGKLGNDNYQLTLLLSYDANGYRVIGKGEEEVFDDDGNLKPGALQP